MYVVGCRVLRRGFCAFAGGYDTGIKVYSPLTRRVENLRSRYPNLLTWYACGPTVYDSAHIGHASCYMKQDMVRRIVESIFGVPVLMAMGVTDIDDKIVARAHKEGVPFTVVTSRFEKEFFSDMDRLGILPPLIRLRVTDNINLIENFIESLIEDGHAYCTPDGSVYFRLSSSQSYGKLGGAGDSTGREPTEHKVVEKENVQDWALWKAAKEGEPSWPSPWGHGRPGWHVECSAMASWLFGNKIDIHSGGVDLAFPHHENEEAQSCCYHGINQWVEHWLHFGHLNLKGDMKMSKSLKNTVSISEFLETYSAEHMRMLCLLSKYRNGIEFSEEVMENAVNVYRKFINFLNDCRSYTVGMGSNGDIKEPELLKLISDVDRQVKEGLGDNFDTSKAASKLVHLVSVTNTMIHSKDSESSTRSPLAVMAASSLVSKYLDAFGFSINYKDTKCEDVGSLNRILESSVEFRCKVRATALALPREKEWKQIRGELLSQCDELRAVFADQGIVLKDLGENTTWNIVK